MSGRATSVVSDGFDNVGYCDTALIAGMGGEEICSILLKADNLPNTLVLQPMKNCDKVRLTAVSLGFKIVYDKLFKSAGKYYDLVVLTKGKDFLTEEEIEFGRDNLFGQNSDFSEMITDKISKLESYCLNVNLSEEKREKMVKEIEKLKKYV